MKQQAQYGSWKSPITAAMVSEGALSFSEAQLSNNNAYWLEGRSSEGGRVALMCWDEQQGERELLPKEYSVRTRVHEYGGGALLVTPQAVFFVRDQDQQVYSYKDGIIAQITHEANARFADGAYNAVDGSLVYVRESHAHKEVANSIVRINTHTGEITEVAQGNDFYASPRVSPDGKKIAYVTWHHPNMPWDATELWVFDTETKEHTRIVGNGAESVCDPRWAPDGQLYYVSDRSNWWNIYTQDHTPVWELEAEFTLPQWLLGRTLIGFSGNSIICAYTKNAINTCAHITRNGDTTTITDIQLPYTVIRSVAAEGTNVLLIAGSGSELPSLVWYDLSTKQHKVIKKSRAIRIDEAYIPEPQALVFPTTNGAHAHAFYYPPTNPQFTGLDDEKPALLVLSHGGPTAHVAPLFNPEIIYWTSRGFAVIDVNYGGSTGYGREYRNRLKGNWGIVDVDDCTNAALYCIEHGLADSNRIAIAGGSAGGFTTLAVLAFKDVFKVGANHFGVSDLEVFVGDTHKFESRYLEQLVGKYPDEIAKYRERSPVHSIHTITSPVIIFQGDEDAIVPPNQSEIIFKSLLERGIPTAYLLFKGEQHGFRRSENIQRSLDAQLYFFARVLNFTVSDDIEPVEISNLKGE